MKTAATLILLARLETSLIAGEIRGREVDLAGGTIRNVTLQITDQYGEPLFARRFDDGNYYVTVNDAKVPKDNQGMTVIFSAPGRETVQVNLHMPSMNTFNVVLPIRGEASYLTDRGYIPCKKPMGPSYVYPHRDKCPTLESVYPYRGPRYHDSCCGW